jgi:hypothetical protein
MQIAVCPVKSILQLYIGELLKIKVSDVSDRTITLREPKSGKDTERAYMPENVSKNWRNISRRRL